MRRFLVNIANVLGIQSARTKNVTKHVLWSFLYKGGHIIATFLLVPLTIEFLDTENYGIWLTLSSFIAWFSFFDIGLGNGLRNKFAEARAKGDFELAKGYVSTAYYSIGIICLIFLMLSLLIGYFIDWPKVFNTTPQLRSDLHQLMPIVFGCFSLQLILKMITSVYIGNQDHSIQGKISFIIAASSLFLVWLLAQVAESSLLLFGSIFSVLPIIILLALNIWAFTGEFKAFRPQRSYWKKEHLKDIFGLGVTFFIVQISVLVMFSTDNFIITQLFSPEDVVPYTIAYKYMSISFMLFTILLTPLWSSITDAYIKGDMAWIKRTMKNLLKFMMATLLLILILVLAAPFAYNIWLGNLVVIPFGLTLSMAVFFIVQICYSPFNLFINGVGKIRLHMYSFALGAIMNIPLSILLVKYTTLGVKGVIIATIFCVAPNLILFPIQYRKLINKSAHGIWNK